MLEMSYITVVGMRVAGEIAKYLHVCEKQFLTANMFSTKLHSSLAGQTLSLSSETVYSLAGQTLSLSSETV